VPASLSLPSASIPSEVTSEAVSPCRRDPARPLAVGQLTQDRRVGTHVHAVDRHHGDRAERALFAQGREKSFVRLPGACPRATTTDAELHDQGVLSGRLSAALVAQLRERGPTSNDAAQLRGGAAHRTGRGISCLYLAVHSQSVAG